MKRLLFWQKLLILMGISMFILATGLSLAAWFSFKQAQSQIGIEGYTTLSEQTEQFLKNQVQERARNLELQFAQTNSIASYGSGVLDLQLKNIGENKEAIQFILKKMHQSLSDPSAKVYFNSKKNGLIVYPPAKEISSTAFGIGFQISSYFPSEEDFKNSEKNSFWTKPHPSAFDGGYDWVVDIISPLNKKKPYDTFIGISISLTDLITQFNQLHPTRGSYSFLTDNHQNLVAALPHARIELAPNGKFIEKGLIELGYAENDLLNTAIKEMSLGRSSLMKVSIKGGEKYLAFHPLEEIDWRLGIVVPVSTATAASIKLQSIVETGMKEALLRMLFGAIVILVVSLFIGGVLIRRLLVPLQEVSLASKSMVGGDFKQRVNVTGKDEIGLLSQAFNQMANHIQVLISNLEQRANELEQLNESLEQKVSERTSNLKERTNQLDQANKKLQLEIKEREEIEKALMIANETLQLLATVDSLTQIPNRHYFDEKLREEWKRLTRDKRPIALIILDVDFFKQYNDFYGHQLGDSCLFQIAKLTSKSIKRPADFVARYGGEEFILVLPDTEQEGAIQIAKQIMQNIQEEAIPHKKSKISKFITVSLGIACVTPTLKTDSKELIALADRALYNSKKQGRNKYSCL